MWTRSLFLILLILVFAGPVSAQTATVPKITIGGTQDSPQGSSVRLQGLGTSTTGTVMTADSDGDLSLTSSLSFTSGAATFSGAVTITGASTLTGGFTSAAASSISANLTISGANDLIVGTGGIRAGSGAVIIRNVADSSTSASFGDSSITLSRNTTASGTFGVSGLTTLAKVRTTGVYGTASPFLIRNSTDAATLISVPDSGDVAVTNGITLGGDAAVNGGDITSTASTLNINSGSTINLLDDLVMGASKPMRSSHYASATTGWGITYDGAADFRYLYVDELHAKAFIADLEMALNGGQVIAKSTAILASAFTCPAASGTATLVVRDFPGFANIRVFAASDWVSLRSFSRTDADNDGNTDLTIGDCVGQVSSYVDGTGGTDGTQSWTFTRGAGGNAGSMASSTVVAADAIVIDYGVSGQGFLIARANDGAEGINSPYWQTVTWTTAPVAANMTVQTRWGNLNGSYGYSSSEYGFGAGPSSGQHITVDPTNGFRVRNSTTTWAQMSGSGLTVGVTAAGNGNIFADTSGNLFIRQGTVNRMIASAANGNFDWVDDDGTTVRARIGSTQAQFGGTTGQRIDLNYSGSVAIFNPANERLFYLDGDNFIFGNIYDSAGVQIADRSYVHVQDSSISLCATVVGCGFQVFSSGGTTSMTLAGNITMGGSMALTGGGNIVSTSNFALNSTDGLLFSDSTSDTNYPRMVRWASGAFIRGDAGLQMRSGPGVGGSYGLVQLLGSPSVGGQVTLTSSTGSTTSTAYFLAHSSGGSTLYAGSILPATLTGVLDGTQVIGLSSARYDNINLALDPNASPAFVIVNKGGGGADATSALGYIAGFSASSATTKVMGACSVTIVSGIITNVTGC